MSLRLRFQNSGAQPGARPAVEMTGGALTIGRGAENDLALPDPDRTLSKRHCVIEERSGDYVLIDLSTNGAYLNYSAERLGDVPTPLNHGDVILLGGYELVVEIAAGAGADPADAPAPPAPQGLGDVLDGAADGTGGDFLDELLGGLDAGGPGPGAAPAPLASTTPVDPFGLSPEPAPFADPFAAPGAPPTGFGASAPDHAPAGQDHFAPPRAGGALIPDDWESLVGPSPAAAAPALAPAPIPAPPAPAPAASGDAARAFLAAAGLAPAAVTDAELTEVMARTGRAFAAMVAGLREILMARASIKSELRMDRTLINRGGNNPLKFSIGPEQAVEAMIRPAHPGYLDAETAAAEALDDIRAHEVAMMSGMDAALRDLLARLAPGRIAAGVEAGGLLGGRKARCWDAFEKHHADIARETEDDFQSAFGQAFARAYADQLQTLKGGRP